MNLEEQEFDDFQSGVTSYVNEDIERVIERELSEIESYKEEFDEQLVMLDEPSDTLTEIGIGYIQATGEVNQVTVSNYRAKKGVGLDAWGFNGDDENTTVDLFLTVYIDPYKSKKLSASDIDKKFNWLQKFYEQALSGSIFSKIKDHTDDLHQVATLINQTKNINRLRLYLITNAIIPANFEKMDADLDEDVTCEYHVWDVKRLMQQSNILSGKNPIVVNFEGDYNTALPCVKVPDVSENVRCYLTYIPGMVLAQVYNKYHQQILEKNVRTFLQFKGASNKGIRDTLIGHKATAAEIRKGGTDRAPEPDMFFAYNNGISATAAEITLDEDENKIIKIKDWQIVNGGQTTAAVSAVMKMKDIDPKAMATVFVPMKITVVKDIDKIDEIVPQISRFANTQSAVKKSDFNINEPFLVELEDCSRQTWVLNSDGKPVSKWFFERTRGQYLDKAKRNQTPKSEREFYAEYPQEQMFDKSFLSKVMMAWDQNPAIVCKGGENCYGAFFKKAKMDRLKFDTTRYQRTIAKIILFKTIDAFYGKEGISLPGYKSNLVAYTLALLSYKSGKSIDLDTIWKEQCAISQNIYNELTISLSNVYAKLITGAEHIVYKVKKSYVDENGKRKNKYEPKEIPAEDLQALRNTKLYRILEYVKEIEPIIYKHLLNVNEGENINEWTKKSLCWDALKNTFDKTGSEYDIDSDLKSSLGDIDVLVTEGQMKVIKEATEISPERLFELNKWSKDNPGNLTPSEQAFTGQAAFLMKRGRALTYKQSRWLLSIIDKAESKGWDY